MCRSASLSSSQGRPISSSAKASNGRQRASTGRTAPRRIAKGSRIAAAIAVREKTRNVGLSWPSATLMNRS